MSFTLRFPFRVSPGRKLTGLENVLVQAVGPCTWTLEAKEPFYILTISGFQSDDACRHFKDELWAAFMWVQLRKGIAFKAEHAFDTIVYRDNPEQAARNLEKSTGMPYAGPVDGLANGNFPVTYPSDTRLRFVTGGDVTFTIGTPAKQIVDVLFEGLEVRRGMAHPLDERLQTALDLYAAYWYEQTLNAKFLTLMLALECLMTPTPRHHLVRQMLDAWKPDVEARRDTYPSGSDEYLALNSLLNELIFKSSDSLGLQLRALVKSSLAAVNDSRADVLSERARKVYGQRSKLVHNGSLPPRELEQITQEAKEIVEAVLEAQFRSR